MTWFKERDKNTIFFTLMLNEKKKAEVERDCN